MKNKTVVVDLTKCKDLGMIHPIIKEAFGFPDEYGHNWNAFRDLLFWEYPVTKVIVRGVEDLPSIFKGDMDIFLEILDDMKKDCEQNNETFEYDFN